MSVVSNKKIVEEFIQLVWNEGQLSNLGAFIHDEYYDHSFVKGVPPNSAGLQFWIQSVSASFQHHTIIEAIVAEDNLVAVRVSFRAKHIGRWRNMEPTGKEVQAKGFRQFELKNGKIIAHWGLLDGESIQANISEIHQGCQLPQ